MKTYINDILIDQSSFIPRQKKYQVTSESVQSSEFSNIARHVKSLLPEFTLQCNLTGSDREERFIRIGEIANKKEIVKILQEQEFENLVITDITETSRFINVVSFSISFQEVNVVTFQPFVEIIESIEKIEIVEEEEEIEYIKPSIQIETSEGLQTITEEDLSDEVINELFREDFERLELLGE
jgi:SepF-like predicted cell division protein (DUF552 family)